MPIKTALSNLLVQCPGQRSETQGLQVVYESPVYLHSSFTNLVSVTGCGPAQC